MALHRSSEPARSSEARRGAPHEPAQPASDPAAVGLLGFDARPGPAALLALQRAVGNRQAQRLLQRVMLDGPRIQRVTGPPRPTLRRGSSHTADVEHLQTRLNEDGAAPALEVDGLFGPLTHAATVEFQRRHGLAPDGVVGPQTWGALNALERAGIAGPEDALSGTRPVTAEQHLAVEQALHPNAQPSGGGVATPPMTGAGVGNEFEQDMLAALDAFLDPMVKPENDQPASQEQLEPIRAIADAAQEVTEDFFARYLVMASRTPTGSYHPGSFQIPFRDASTRQVDRADAAGWVDYFMAERSYTPSQILDQHNVDTTRARPDRAEYNRVRDLYVRDTARFQKVRNVIHGWPAEAGSGTVFVQPRAYQDRTGMWGLFKTMIHEFLHLVTHPNYDRAAVAIGGGARQALIEGFTDHFTLQVWHHVRDSLEGNLALRTRVEGAFFQPDLDPKSLNDPSTYSQDAPDAIVAAVGEENTRAAYFMGHAELLGLGAGTRSEAPLTGVAAWEPTDSVIADIYTVRPGGETLAQIRERTNANTVVELDGTAPTDLSQRFDAGHQLRVAGIRWHRAILEDTRAQVAGQNGVTLAQLELANGWTQRPGDTPVAPGTLVLIPRH